MIIPVIFPLFSGSFLQLIQKVNIFKLPINPPKNMLYIKVNNLKFGMKELMNNDKPISILM